MSQCEQAGKWSELVRRTAIEIAIAQPGADQGLLPLNSLLMELEECHASATVPPALAAGLTAARLALDKVFDTTAKFDDASLQWFCDWQTWMQSASDAWASAKPVPDFPAQLRADSKPSNDAPAAAPSIQPVDDEEAPLSVALDADDELLREFIAESHEHLETIERSILVLEEKPDDADTLNAIFRGFHTFKGGSGLLKLTPIQNLAHDLESLLDALRQHELRITRDIITLILEGSDALKQFIISIEKQVLRKDPPGPIFVPTAALRARARATLAGDIESVAPPQPKAAPTRNEVASPVVGRSSSYVKVDTQKLDSLIDMIGEQVIAQSMVVQDPAVLGLQSQQLVRNLAQLRRVTNELQRTAMALRMVPVSGTFQKVQRLVRDISAKQQKQVRLVLEGEETELDRNVVESLGESLVHMVRNAIDHGIEKPQLRIASGKPGEGTIRLAAFHRGGNIGVQMEDDGAGLNTQRIREKAIERGIISESAVLTEKELCRLIFKPGFSTAANITELSGRGVGLDVVQRNIEKLRGKVEVESTPGSGTRFTLLLPLTLAIIDGLIIGTGSERYILPTLSVKESFRPKPGMISTVAHRGEIVNVRGRLTPVLRLADHFGVKPRSSDPCESIGVVIESGDAWRCLLVDELIGKQEVVIKNLNTAMRRDQSLAGAAILGDGRVGLILDVDSLVRLAPNGISLSE